MYDQLVTVDEDSLQNTIQILVGDLEQLVNEESDLDECREELEALVADLRSILNEEDNSTEVAVAAAMVANPAFVPVL